MTEFIQNSSQMNNQVFRKMLDINKPNHVVELEVAKRIMQEPQKNVVKIFDAVRNECDAYIDMELLETQNTIWQKCILDVINGLSQLHTLNVVYIDIKQDNVGYSSQEGVYKLFDFDCCGIVQSGNGKKWQHPPFQKCFIYKEVKRYEHVLPSLYKLDDMIIKRICDRLIR